MKNHVNIAMLASGSGTNVENFIQYFHKHPTIKIALVVSDREKAFVLERARNHKIPGEVIPGPLWKDAGRPAQVFSAYRIDYLVLAGFLRMIPAGLIEMFPKRILNIHPALLPAFGGKGMYGMHVHRAVIDSGASESGISIHRVNAFYDEGKVLFQARVPVHPTDTPETLAEKIHQLEYKHFPEVVEMYVLLDSPSDGKPNQETAGKRDG